MKGRQCLTKLLQLTAWLWPVGLSAQTATYLPLQTDAGLSAAVSGMEELSDSLLYVLLPDSLEDESHRYFVPDSCLAQADSLQEYLIIIETELEALASEPLPDRAHWREPSDLERFVNRYDIMRGHRPPRPSKPLPPEANPFDYIKMNPMFMPLVFDGSWQDMSPRFKRQPYGFAPRRGMPGPQSRRTFGLDTLSQAAQDFVMRQSDEIRWQMESSRMDLFHYSQKDMPQPLIMEMLQTASPMHMPMPSYAPHLQRRAAPDPHYDYNYWVIKGHLSGQMTQTWISKNWSSGGNSNMSTLQTFYWTAKYDDKKNIQFDNVIDVRMGVNTTNSDTLRSLSVNVDQFQASSKLGIKAVKNWYYSAQAEVITQFLNNYKVNTYDLKSSFLSPAKLFVSLGMDYKVKSRDKSRNFSLLLTPLTYRLNYLLDTEHFKASSYGVTEGKHFGHEFGFKVTSNLNWKITDELSLISDFYYYSDFGYVDSEWKNTVNFMLNQFLSTQLFVHLKYDDRIRNEEYKTHLQMKEYLSFGVTWYW